MMGDSTGRTVIPKASLKRCYLCQNLLTVPPIKSVSLESENYKCGRCQEVNMTTYNRSMLFEDVAKFLSFPCTYESCTKELLWSQVKAHEKECLFRTIQCPVYYQQCNETIQVEKIKEHFHSKHSQNIMQCNETPSVSNTSDYVFLMTAQGLDFLVYILHNNGRHAISVFATKPLTKFTKYDVKVAIGAQSEFTIVYEGKNICHYDEKQHCYRCIDGHCEFRHHPFASRQSDISFDEYTILRNPLTNDSKADIKYTVNLIEENSQPPPQGKSKDADEASDTIRRQMECPICERYLIAPIFLCKTGHTICNLCKPRLKKCPTCESELTDSRNYHLEGTTEVVNLPCVYKFRGCTYSGNTEKIARHEFDCPYKD